MKVPISWLREYVEFDDTAENLADRLTFSGTEVEGIDRVGSDYRDVVAAEVLDIQRHPNADRLRVCRVGDGASELQVVCGADNFAAGDRVVLARIGAKLPNGTAITRAKLRGVESHGMLCAEDELGLSEDHSGILLLPKTTRPGTPLVEIVGAPETVLDLEITWNRSDCLSLIGMAYEVAALYGLRVRRPDVSFAEAAGPVEAEAAVAIEDAVGCPRYTARVIRDVTWGPSPAWMQRRLSLCGVRPIGNVVDVTNYVMLECGQPLHAFDHRLLAGRRIVVRRVRAGEALATLDGIQRPVTPEMLAIADAERPVALAGIMGGAGSEISPETRTVLLESAAFDPALIHRTSQRLGLATESSRRFERGIDVGNVEWASRRAAALIVAHAGGAACRGVLDAYPAPVAPRRLACRPRRASELIGAEISAARMAAIFEGLGLPVVERGPEAVTVEVPTRRRDLEIEADLVEETARLHGLDKIPDAVPAARVVPGAGNRRVESMHRFRATLAGLGLTEVMNYSFLSPQLLDAFSRDEAGVRVALPNPVSADHSVMRDSLVPQMVDTLGRNLAHQNTQAALFEIGRVFYKEKGAVREEERLSIGLMGAVGRVGPAGKSPVQPEEMLLWVKGIVEALAAAQGVGAVAVEAQADPACDEGWAFAVVAGGRRIGRIGIVAAAARHRWRMTEPVGVAELQTEALLAEREAVPALRAISPYPAVERDVAMIVPESVSHADVLRVVRGRAPVELTDVALFDIFRGKAIGEGRKSLAYTLTYRSMERSLTDEEANRFHDVVKQALRGELSAEIRES